MIYTETDDTLGIVYNWPDAQILLSQITHRNTHIEIVKRPKWGLTCYMDGTIQSCKLDEKLYHTTLVSDHVPSGRICIFGGGEGATAREILANPLVDRIDMYEWDRDVVSIFQNQFPQWAENAWNDTRLHIFYEDVFQIDLYRGYDAFIIDLFEPEEFALESWKLLLERVFHALRNGGKVAMYAGMISPFPSSNTIQISLIRVFESIGFTDISISKKYIPSFMGECAFLYAKKPIPPYDASERE